MTRYFNRKRSSRNAKNIYRDSIIEHVKKGEYSNLESLIVSKNIMTDISFIKTITRKGKIYYYRWWLLHQAIYNNDPRTLAVILRYGADVNKVPILLYDGEHDTVYSSLVVSYINGYDEIFKMLIDHGVCIRSSYPEVYNFEDLVRDEDLELTDRRVYMAVCRPRSLYHNKDRSGDYMSLKYSDICISFN